MGNNCSCKVIPKDSQLPAPQEERATSSKVVPKKKSYRKTKRNPRHCKPSHDSERSAAEPGGAAGSSSSSAEVRSVVRRLGLWHTKSSCIKPQTSTVRMVDKACNTSEDMFPAIIDDNNIELSPEASLNCEDRELCEEDRMKTLQEAEEPALVVIQLRSGSYIIVGLKKPGVRCCIIERNTERSEPLLVTTAEKACGTADDIDETEDMTDTSIDSLESEHSPDVLSDKDQQKTTPKEETTKVQSRKCRWIRSVVRRLGLWHTKSSCIKPQTSTVRMVDKACNTSEVIVGLKKPGVRCCITERNTERSEPLLVTTAEKACGTADDPAELGEGPFGPPRIAWM